LNETIEKGGHMDLFKSLKPMMIVVVVLLPLLLSSQSRATEDLSSAWLADDGGAYYMRQAGNTLWWNGMRKERQEASFANFFKDISPGQLEVRKQRETGGFGGSIWRKANPPYQTGPLIGTQQRKVRPDGKVEIRYPDGTIVLLYDGGRTVISPDGKERHTVHINIPAPTPPSLPKDNRITSWLKHHNNYLLDIIRSLVGNDQESINNYLRYEGTNSSLYKKINKRAETIGRLTQ
jgi:hypothetical protein